MHDRRTGDQVPGLAVCGRVPVVCSTDRRLPYLRLKALGSGRSWSAAAYWQAMTVSGASRLPDLLPLASSNNIRIGSGKDTRVQSLQSSDCCTTRIRRRAQLPHSVNSIWAAPHTSITSARTVAFQGDWSQYLIYKFIYNGSWHRQLHRSRHSHQVGGASCRRGRHCTSIWLGSVA